jgi:hypothetical protein
MSNSQAPTIPFTVAVDTSNGVYYFFNKKGQPSHGGATVTVPNTKLMYSLVNNSNSLIFLEPQISAKCTDDLKVTISDCKQVMTIIDSDLTNEDICLRLVMQSIQSGESFVSPDPKIVNRPD